MCIRDSLEIRLNVDLDIPGNAVPDVLDRDTCNSSMVNVQVCDYIRSRGQFPRGPHLLDLSTRIDRVKDGSNDESSGNDYKGPRSKISNRNHSHIGLTSFPTTIQCESDG